MKLKLFILILLLVPICLNGQNQKRENEIYISCGDSVTIYKASDFYAKMAEFWKNHKVDTIKPTIIVGRNYAIINEPAARIDLQEYESMKIQLWLDSIIIAEQRQEIDTLKKIIVHKDGLLVKADSTNNQLTDKYNWLANNYTACEKDRKKWKFAAKVFEYTSMILMGAAFYFGVK